MKGRWCGILWIFLRLTLQSQRCLSSDWLMVIPPIVLRLRPKVRLVGKKSAQKLYTASMHDKRYPLYKAAYRCLALEVNRIHDSRFPHNTYRGSTQYTEGIQVPGTKRRVPGTRTFVQIAYYIDSDTLCWALQWS